MQSFPHSLSDSSIVETDIPARLDRLPWGRFHTRVVVALGITWILDGLEVTLVGALSGALKESRYWSSLMRTWGSPVAPILPVPRWAQSSSPRGLSESEESAGSAPCLRP